MGIIMKEIILYWLTIIAVFGTLGWVLADVLEHWGDNK